MGLIEYAALIGVVGGIAVRLILLYTLRVESFDREASRHQKPVERSIRRKGF